jgi:hypothetical protein
MACRFYGGYSTILSRNTSSKRDRAMPRMRIYFLLLDTIFDSPLVCRSLIFKTLST